ncbi:MAG: thiamine pyrophosphate-binding protein [Acidobacteria bacterium]|nr:MAG: thiamine pyrophosphate-binding protein [Acidobacteriota bacterium]
MTQKITVADDLLKELERIGVDTVFGIISIHNIPFYDSLQRHGGFRLVTGRHEGAVVNMADAYSRISGKLGVALTSTGTGAGNAAGAIIESWNGGAPLLHITGTVASSYIGTGRGYIHDCKDQLGMLKSVSKEAYRVRRSEEAPTTFQRAIAEALNPPAGPVSVEVPIDFQASLINPSTVVPSAPAPVVPPDSELTSAVEKMLRAKRPVIWAGSGAMFSDSSAEVIQLMEALDAAVITTQSGRGIVPETDSRCLGHFATFPALQDFVAKADLLISIGVRFRGNETSNWSIKTPSEHIGIDADPSAINRNFPHSLGIVGDAKRILPPLLRLLRAKDPRPKLDYREEVAGLHRALRKEVRDTMGPWEGILDAIQEFMPEDAILVRDVTVPATTWGSRLITRRSPRTTLHASAGGIGQGLPMAIGAQIAAPSKKVVLLAGDGGLLVNIGELAAARQENTPIVTILFDDAGYGVLRNIQNAHYEGKTIGVDLQSPDFVAVARAFGFGSERVRSVPEFRNTFARAVKSGEPWMVVVDSNSIGPMKKIFAGPDGGAALYKPH